jgi:hypothetical protein
MSTRSARLNENQTLNLNSIHHQSLTMTDASTTLNPIVPLTRKSGLTTPQLAPRGDMAALPKACPSGIETLRMNASNSSSEVKFAAGDVVPNTLFLSTGAENNF